MSDINESTKIIEIDEKDPVSGKVIATLEFKAQTKVEAEIYDIFVDPSFRRRGIARKLINKMLDNIKELSIPYVFLEVAIDNRPAINLYKSFGFIEVGKREKYYDNKTDALIMRCDVFI